jgi:hypothetical protein
VRRVQPFMSELSCDRCILDRLLPCKITHFVFLHINNWLCLRSSTSQVETDSLMENIGNVLLKLQNEQKFIYMLIVDHVCVRCSVGI